MNFITGYDCTNFTNLSSIWFSGVVPLFSKCRMEKRGDSSFYALGLSCNAWNSSTLTVFLLAYPSHVKADTRTLMFGRNQNENQQQHNTIFPFSPASNNRQQNNPHKTTSINTHHQHKKCDLG